MWQGTLKVPMIICINCNKNETTEDDKWCLNCLMKSAQIVWERNNGPQKTNK